MGYGFSIAVSRGVGHRCSSDPVLLWLWHRPAATDLIRPLAWEPPCAAGAALEKTKTQKTNNSNKKKQWSQESFSPNTLDKED